MRKVRCHRKHSSRTSGVVILPHRYDSHFLRVYATTPPLSGHSYEGVPSYPRDTFSGLQGYMGNPVSLPVTPFSVTRSVRPRCNSLSHQNPTSPYIDSESSTTQSFPHAIRDWLGVPGDTFSIWLVYGPVVVLGCFWVSGRVLFVLEVPMRGRWDDGRTPSCPPALSLVVKTRKRGHSESFDFSLLNDK